MTQAADDLRARLTVEFLHECFDCRDGSLFWRFRPAAHFRRPPDQAAFNTKMAGKRAGKIGTRGYITLGLRIDGRAISIAAHRIVWALHYGKWPSLQIDHINRVRDDINASKVMDADLALSISAEVNDLLSARHGADPDRLTPNEKESPASPAGFVLVPVEPTPEMLKAAGEAHGYPHGETLVYELGYKAMLAAAPTVEANP